MNAPAPSSDRRLLFRRRQRLTLDREYRRAYAAGCSAASGPLRVHLALNGLNPPVTRLGLSVGRRVGSATMRTRLKRLLREAFRLSQSQLPVGMDLVVSVHPHEPLTLDQYTSALLKAVAAARARQKTTTPRSSPKAPSHSRHHPDSSGSSRPEGSPP
jgi:ribonuclease P protein component